LYRKGAKDEKGKSKIRRTLKGRIAEGIGLKKLGRYIDSEGHLVRNRTGKEKLKDDLRSAKKFGGDVAEGVAGLVGMKKSVKNIRKYGLKEGMKENIFHE